MNFFYNYRKVIVIPAEMVLNGDTECFSRRMSDQGGYDEQRDFEGYRIGRVYT